MCHEIRISKPTSTLYPSKSEVEDYSQFHHYITVVYSYSSINTRKYLLEILIQLDPERNFSKLTNPSVPVMGRAQTTDAA